MKVIDEVTEERQRLISRRISGSQITELVEHESVSAAVGTQELSDRITHAEI